ncbi:MAG: alpha/beta hydrolase [Proteobacteria bacterium]|nr:alpha/beta hydrolase [Pseudomonadota bacterium]
MLLPYVNRFQRWRLGRAGFRDRAIDTPECRVHALDFEGRGDLPPLVVVHGICAEGAQFADTLLALRPHFSRIIVPDLPAHGRSGDPRGGLSADTLSSSTMVAMDALIDDSALVVGNSLGGLASVRYALERPHNVRALYLSSPAGGYQEPDVFQSFLKRLHLTSWREGVAFVSRIYGAPPLHRFFIGGGVRSLFSRPTMANFVQALSADDLLSPEQIRSLQMPVRLVWGGRDHLLPYEQFEFYREHLPETAVFEEPAHWGHCPYLDTPKELARSILDWAEAEA